MRRVFRNIWAAFSLLSLLMLIGSGCRPGEVVAEHISDGTAGNPASVPEVIVSPASAATLIVAEPPATAGAQRPVVYSPTEAPPATAGPLEPTRQGSALLSKLGSDQGNIPSLDSDATRAPTPTPVDIPLPQVASGLTVEKSGSGFAAQVSGNVTLDFVKIGFHVGPGGDSTGLSHWMETLDAAGIPFFLKSVDNAGPLLEAQRLREASGVPHVLVYRAHGGEFELPDYTLNPILAAREHWARHLAAFPAELDPAVVWMETINEVDKERAGWLGLFALETGRLAVQDGRRWAAFGWSAGEPEIEHWQLPAMVNFLKFAADHPEQVAIALHEYSYETFNIMRDAPHLVGRFQQLYWVTDELGIRRPTVLITEFGWEYRDVPLPETALTHIRAAAQLYGGFPEVKGAAIWYLGPGYGQIDHQTQKLIAPLTDYAATHYFQHPVVKAVDPRIFE